MNRKAKTRKSGEILLTSADIPRLESEIRADIKERQAIDGRLAQNRKLLAAAMLLAQHAGRAKKPRKAAKESAKAQGNGSGAIIPAEQASAAPVSGKLPRGGGSVGIVLTVLQDNPQGLAPTEVQKKASEHPAASVSIREHGQYVYSVLDTLKKRGQVVRGDDGKWRATGAGANPPPH